MPEERISTQVVYDMLAAVHDELKALNGTVKQNCVDIAVLKEQQRGNTSNWDRVWSVLQPVVIAIITALVITAAKTVQ